jgi:hypothetical protein
VTLRRGRALRLVLAVGIGSCTLVASAHAQAPAPAANTRTSVLLRTTDCYGASGARVSELAALELAPHMNVLAQSDSPVLTGEVQCEGEHAAITVRDRGLAQPLSVRVDLAAAAPEARERLLALALAELINTRVLERNAAQAREQATPPPPPPLPDDEEEDEDDSADGAEPAGQRAPLHFWITPVFSLAATPTSALFGAGVGGSRVLGPLLLALDLLAQFGQNDRSASDVALRLLSASVSLGPILIDNGTVRLSITGGVRAGHAQLSADSNRAGIEARDVSEFWIGPAAIAALQLPLLGTTGLRIALEAGAIARPIVGTDQDGDERLALRGFWASASAGFVLPFP